LYRGDGTFNLSILPFIYGLKTFVVCLPISRCFCAFLFCNAPCINMTSAVVLLLLGWYCFSTNTTTVKSVCETSSLASVCGVTARQCPSDMEWTECLPLCGSTCESLPVLGGDNAWHTCLYIPSECLPGCKCRGGSVYDRSVGPAGSCVAPTECNCHFQGVVYPPQSTIAIDCNEWFVYRR